MTKTTPAESAARTAEPATLPRLLSLTETADLLGCSLKTLRRRIEAGDLVVVRDGRLVRVHPQDLARYVAARRSL